MSTASTKAPNETFLDGPELDVRWGMKKGAVYRMTREGLLEDVVTHLGRYYRYRLDRVEAFEARGGTAAEKEN